MISKEKFVKHIDDIKFVKNFHKGLNSFLSSNGADGYLITPDTTANTIELLHDTFGVADKEEWIEYFIFELDFGKKWKPGYVKDNGKDIPLSTAEELYDFLISNLNG